MLSVGLLCGVLITLPHPLKAQSPDLIGEAWRISLGGRLYDNHWLETQTAPPEQRNPRYPKSVEIRVADTWRCVSCHGWDYRGRDGHLGRLTPNREFASLRSVDGEPVSEIAVALQSGGHRNFVEALSKDQIEALALFLSAGQHDVIRILGNGKSTGAPMEGKDIFEGACVSCHQADGKAYIEGETGDKPALGWVAQNKPEQALHKIRNGVPGADMLSLRFLEQSRLADLLAYLQTLDPTTE